MFVVRPVRVNQVSRQVLLVGVLVLDQYLLVLD